MGFDLLSVHIAGADGPDQSFGASLPPSEHDKEATAFRRDANRAEPLLGDRMKDIAANKRLSEKQTLRFRD
jgi:hypothetical protein